MENRNDGIKVFFKLKDRCFDAGKYSLFYKAFAQKFSQQYELNQFVDQRTSDVSRACFYSYDKEAFFNPNAQQVDMNTIINFTNELEIREIERDIKAYENSTKPEKKSRD